MLRTLTLAHGWAKASNGAHFTVKLSNSRNVLNTALNVKYRIAVRALVFYPWDRMAATAPHHKARAYYVLLIQEKIKIQNLKSGLYLRHSTFTLFKAKKKKKVNFPGGPMVRNPPAHAGFAGSTPAAGRSHMLSGYWACPLESGLHNRGSHSREKPVHN